MISEKILYQKRYQREDAELDAAIQAEIDKQHDDVKWMTPDDIIKSLTNGLESEEIPGRRQSVKDFIRTAIQISEIYELDIKITRYDTHVTVDYNFDFGGALGWMIDIIKMADDVSLFHPTEGHEIIMSIDYYTHAVYRRGKKILPRDW